MARLRRRRHPYADHIGVQACLLPPPGTPSVQKNYNFSHVSESRFIASLINLDTHLSRFIENSMNLVNG